VIDDLDGHEIRRDYPLGYAPRAFTTRRVNTKLIAHDGEPNA
jgi:hypothetical protein